MQTYVVADGPSLSKSTVEPQRVTLGVSHYHNTRIAGTPAAESPAAAELPAAES